MVSAGRPPFRSLVFATTFATTFRNRESAPSRSARENAVSPPGRAAFARRPALGRQDRDDRDPPRGAATCEHFAREDPRTWTRSGARPL